MFSFSRSIISIFFISFLSACQTQRAVGPVEVSQLAAVIAGSEWTRNHCARSDIPDKTTLLRVALKIADVKDGGNNNVSQHVLMDDINQRYALINQDGKSKADKCKALNSALAPFLQQVKLQNK